MVGEFVAIGGEPQDLSYWGAATRVEIGDHNMIGDRVTIHRATEKEDGITGIGSGNRILAYATLPTTVSWPTGSRWEYEHYSGAMCASSQMRSSRKTRAFFHL